MKIGPYEVSRPIDLRGVHPAANLFPMLGEAEMAALASDIDANGLRLPIIVRGGMVLDGRNRLVACDRVGQPIRTQEYHDDDCTAYVLSVNVQRRHLTPVQRSTIGLAAEPMIAAEIPKGRPKKSGKNSGVSGEAREIAARAVGVNPHYISDAKAISAKAPDVFQAMQAGTVSMPEAKSLASLPQEKRTAALAKIADAPEKSRARAVVKEIALEEKAAFAAELRAAPVPLPGETHRVIVIDPPWQYDSRAEDVSHRGRNPYPDMDTAAICALPVASLAHEDCILWLWTTNAFMRDAYQCLDAWGFTAKTILTWDKEILGLGDWLRNVTEHCILAVRGKPIVQLTNQTTLIREKRGKHSAKPAAFYTMVEALCPGSKLEMFARAERDGWTRWGAEAPK